MYDFLVQAAGVMMNADDCNGRSYMSGKVLFSDLIFLFFMHVAKYSGFQMSVSTFFLIKKNTESFQKELNCHADIIYSKINNL